MYSTRSPRSGLLFPLALLLGACGGSDGDSSPAPTPVEPTKLSIGGSISGLSGSIGLTLSAGSSQTQSFSGSSFQFSTTVSEGTSFSISISSQPDGQVCSISSASGTLSSANATAAAVSCSSVQSGLLLDSPVAGIGYRTETQSGVTDAMGYYRYLPGESVVFFIGDLAFPAVTATGLLTPEDIAADDATTTLNIARILQTLDDDQNPENGISLSDATKDAFKGSALDISSSAFATAVAGILTTLDNRTLVSESDALSHLQQSKRQQLLGSWLYKEGEGQRNVLTFIDSSHYILFHEHTDDGDQTAGSAELGNYQWDPDSGALSLSLIAESDNSGGLFDNGQHQAKTMTLGDTLTINFTEGSVELSRIDNGAHALSGTWRVWEDSDENLTLVVFLSDTDYALIHTNNLESYQGQQPQALSGEFGKYQFDGDKLSVTSVSVDSDGPGGLYDSDDSHTPDTVKLTNFGELWFFDSEGDERYSLPKVERFSAGLQDYDAAHPLGQVNLLRDPSRFEHSDIKEQAFELKFKLASGEFDTFTVYFGAEGDGFISQGDEPSLTISWEITMAGSVEIHYKDAAAVDFVLTLAPVQGSDNPALMSLTSSEGEDSLWLTTLVPSPI
ncbi:hypothetical protein KJI95_06085 [Shewanella sp. JM162201]|uniref:Uncharacterized protein n=1 Tax=Shewanella jiangmenensis TaxID=2837387 RepID=A0ABS5V2P2_9GAMM|nr:hypothetical protein [Shewanella jiangmenensis]MBT1444092.1 hypothetical protein [Shewanella jiangmenensis]